MTTASLRKLIVPALLLTLAAPAVAQDPPVESKRDVAHYNLGKKGLALSGYDPVAYFPEGGGKPTKGSEKIELRHGGVLYRFASAKHRDLFKKKPARFEPAYGGWCAFAMAQGKKVEVDPKSFLVSGGELTVFYKGFLNDTRKKWLEQPKQLETKADAAWKKTLATKKK
jgi:YHS domain-containing protein